MIYYFLLILNLNFFLNANADLTQIFCTQLKCSACNELALECRNLNKFNLNEIKNCSQSIQTIIYTGNHLNIINETLFNNEMSQLALLDLSNNKIIRFENEFIFKNVPNLFELVLDSNQLDLDTKEHFAALKMFANSLERLSMNRAFTESKSIDSIRSAQIDMEIHNLLSLSELNNLFELRLKENALTSFNIINKGDSSSSSDYSDYSKDILCILPKLKVLHLDHNFIERIDFDINCLNENKSSLEVLHLESNRITTIDLDLIEKFKIFSMLNQDFRVQLFNNPFKCDCSLLNFYKFLQTDESTRIIYNKYQLKCSHDDSMPRTLKKSIVESNLDMECRNADTLTSTLKPRRKIYFPFRNRTFKLNNNNGNNQKPAYRLNSLVLFLFASITLSIIIILLLKYNCRHKVERRRMNRYTNLTEENCYFGTTVDCNRLNGENNNNNNEEDVYLKQKKFANLGNYLKKAASKRFRLDKNRTGGGGGNDDEETISSVPYVEFENENKLIEKSKNATIQKNDLLKKQLKSADDEYSETEERTIMDAAVNNKNVKRTSSLSQSALFVRIP